MPTNKQFEDDLSLMVLSPSGERLMLSLLMQMGLGSPVGTSLEAIARYNMGINLLHDIGAVNAQAALNICISLLNLNMKRLPVL